MTSKKPMNDKRSKYPMLIKYKDTDALVIVDQPGDIDRHRQFDIVRTSQVPSRKTT